MTSKVRQDSDKLFCPALVTTFYPSSGSQMSKKGWMDMRDE